MPHITVCVCTYRRPALLERLIAELACQDTAGLFTYSIVVSDNDRLRSALPIVRRAATRSGVPIEYCEEPRQNIALARNRAIAHAAGDLVAFIDDDELPVRGWLKALFTACGEEISGVLGPVRPHFDTPPPSWVVDGRFYERPTYPTGFVIDWRKGRTGNVLLKRHVFTPGEPAFRPEFLTGEDQDFFRRMIERGHVFTWCNEAVAYEVVPPSRWTRTFMLRRALLRGAVSLVHPTAGASLILKSIVAVPVYTLALPLAICAGQGTFMACLVRLCDHAGRLLASVGIQPIHEPYVTE